MDVIVERPGALDVHKAQVTGCVRVPDGKGGRGAHLAEFKTTVRGLLVLRDWLKAHRVTQVTMEATGEFWKPRMSVATQSSLMPVSSSALCSRFASRWRSEIWALR